MSKEAQKATLVKMMAEQESAGEYGPLTKYIDEAGLDLRTLPFGGDTKYFTKEEIGQIAKSHAPEAQDAYALGFLHCQIVQAKNGGWRDEGLPPYGSRVLIEYRTHLGKTVTTGADFKGPTQDDFYTDFGVLQTAERWKLLKTPK